MSNTRQVTMTVDVYPWGCRGDVVTVTDDDIKQLDKLAKARKLDSVYESGSAKTPATKTAPKELQDRARLLDVNAEGTEEEVQLRVDEAERVLAIEKAGAVGNAQTVAEAPAPDPLAETLEAKTAAAATKKSK